MTQQITIVGAGSAGLRLAKNLAQQDIPVTVYEDHPEIGIPEHCSGLISARNTKELGFDLRESFTNDIYGAKLFSPNNTQLRIESKKPVAHVMDRSLFDKTLYKEAIAAGANIELSTSVMNVKGNTIFTQSRGKGGMKKSDIIV
ncbi:MAG: NAD(P)/FAD-dependent oxidoreductase, partial [archaeon]